MVEAKLADYVQAWKDGNFQGEMNKESKAI